MTRDAATEGTSDVCTRIVRQLIADGKLLPDREKDMIAYLEREMDRASQRLLRGIADVVTTEAYLEMLAESRGDDEHATPQDPEDSVH